MPVTTGTDVSPFSDLPALSDRLPMDAKAGIPENFSNLFVAPEARLLRGEPSIPWTRNAAVVVYRYRDVLDMATHPAAGNTPAERLVARLTSGNHDVTEADLSSVLHSYRNLVFATNPPEHGPLRKMIAQPLTPKHSTGFAPIAKKVISEVLEEVVDKGEIDFVDQFCARVTAKFWGELLGMKEEEIEIANSSISAMALGLLTERTSEMLRAVEIGQKTYTRTLSTAIYRSLKAGRSEMLQAMAARFKELGADDKQRDFAEVISANIIDGYHTIAVACANAVYQLTACPEALAAVRANHALAEKAVDEALRLWPPIPMLIRCALEDFHFAGIKIPRGTAIGMFFAAANRDPEVFPHPNAYRLDRTLRQETTFGGGIHICPGRYTARMLVTAVIEALVSPEIRIELAQTPPAWHPGLIFRQIGMRLSLCHMSAT